MSILVPNQESRFLAVLIDGDNAQPGLIESVMAEASKYGTLTIRRIYGNWTTPQMSGWKEHLHSQAIKPIQQFNYTTGKNSTDSALIIDAMDILHSGKVHGFCIVSSDSDYTGLAVRIRESGMLVVGIGRKTTPESFRAACNIFTYVENLYTPAGETTIPKPEIAEESTTTAVQEEVPRTDPPDWREMVKSAIGMSPHEDDWIPLADVGNNLLKIDPAFDSRTYGFKKLLLLIQSEPEEFEIQERELNYYVRVRHQ